MKTKTNNIDTTYAGSSQFSWLERDPRQVILFAGYPFSKDYNDDRGHANALDDARHQAFEFDDLIPSTRLPPAIPANHLPTLACGMNSAWKPTMPCRSMR